MNAPKLMPTTRSEFWNHTTTKLKRKAKHVSILERSLGLAFLRLM